MKAVRVVVPFLAVTLAAAGAAAANPPQTAGSGSGQASRPYDFPATLVIEPRQSLHRLSPALQGVTHEFYDNAKGLWDPVADAPNADPAEKMARAGIGLLRFPGGSPANLYDWKRSIGPAESRRCQTDGGSLATRNEKEYGPDEFMELARTVGAEPEIVVPFPNASPDDAANWLEYMNAPVGSNPNGGTAWADVRQANGSTAPYGVTRWEIGNEPYLDQQAFWMDSTDTANRLGQFIDGAEIAFTDVPLARNCEFDPPGLTNRSPGQRFNFLYRLIKPGTSPLVKVGGVPWTEVGDLASAGPTDRVYVLDRETGTVTFGDGLHGAIPPRERSVTASYTFEHKGFVAVYDALKSTAAQIGLDVSVCAAWAPIAARGTPEEELGSPSFAQEMTRRGLADRYDCVAAHPYTSLGTDYWLWEDAEDAHHAHMVGDDWAYRVISSLAADLEANSDNDAFVAITELGALWFGNSPEKQASVANMPVFGATMTHAAYMASQWLRYAPMDIGWMSSNDLVPNGLRGTLGGADHAFVYGAEAMTREVLKPFFAPRGTWVRSHLIGQDTMTAPDGSAWPVLMTGVAAAADGALHVAVVNRDPTGQRSVRIVPAGYPHDTSVEVSTVQGEAFTSFNDAGISGGDNTVGVTRTTIETAGRGAFRAAFPPASVTVMTLRSG